MKNITKFTVDEHGIKGLDEYIIETLYLSECDEIQAMFSSNRLTISKTGRFCFVCGSDADLCGIGNNKIICSKCLEAMAAYIK